MYVTKESLRSLAFMLPLLEKLPERCSVDFDGDGVSIQANTQEQVRAVRHVFPGATIWVKQWNEMCQWLEYTTSIDGIAIQIYAVKEAPPACRIVEEEVEQEMEVPVTVERQMVKVVRKRLVCG